MVKEYLKFQSLKRGQEIKVENAFRTGYWNVFKYNKDLERFLIANNVEHVCKDLSEYL